MLKSSNKQTEIVQASKAYTSSDICPCCGVYTPDGEVCALCQNTFNQTKTKPIDLEELLKACREGDING